MKESTRSTRVPDKLAFAVRAALCAGIGALATASLTAFAGDGSEGFVLWGVHAGDKSGNSVSTAGDVNGDGFDDVIIGAPNATANGRPQAGAGYVVFGHGGAFDPDFRLERLMPDGGGDGSEGFVLQGIAAGANAGYAVATVGDVNDDGIDDIACSSIGSGVSEISNVFIVFGRSDGFPATFPLESLLPGHGGDGSRGTVLSLAEGVGGLCRVSNAGDINGDGIADIIIGQCSKYTKNQVYVVYGRDDGFPAALDVSKLRPENGGDGSKGFVILPSHGSYVLVDATVAKSGDVNSDGIDDIFIGSLGGPGISIISTAFVVFGHTAPFPAAFDLDDLIANPGEGSLVRAIRQLQALRIGQGGDLNGDGVADIALGGYGVDSGGRVRAGSTYVVYGGDDFRTVMPLLLLTPRGGGDGSLGTVLPGIAAQDQSGSDVQIIRDVNGDGVDDLLIGAPFADPFARAEAGETYVVFGRPQGFPAVTPLTWLLPAYGGDGSHGFVIAGVRAGDSSGRTVKGAGDVNGDGIDDVIIGARDADAGSLESVGASYVIFGRATGFPPIFALDRLLPD